MQETSNSKQLIAEKVKQSANILVTVSSNPSVDALTAALGLTLMLNKLDKHATAVFSGVVPPAIGFLEPGKTFENNVDSLRDFIIALDKDKADRLRYKVEDDVVRIFITPYRTKISEKDLQFSQGDFNVDLIIALGVEDQKDLDQAITAHGRILHDATVATINAGEQKSSLGSIDWHDKGASSLSEMLATIAESLKPGILDQQISTALLTGIVAATERFSNAKTSPRVMTTAAQLMAAGANQQLIATKLQTIPTPVSPRREKTGDKQPEPSQKVSADTTDNGEMHINHQPEPVEPPAPLPQEAAPEAEKIESVAEPEPELPIAPPAAQNFEDLKQAIQEETPQAELPEEPVAPGSRNINDTGAPAEEQSKPQEEEGYLSSHPSWQGREIKPPSMGGTLNATAEQALEDKMREEEEQKRNRKILTHGGSAAPAVQPQQKEQKPAPVPTPAPVEPAQPAPQPVAPTPPAPEPEAPAPEQPAAEPVNEIPVAPPPLVVSEPVAPEPAQPAPVIEAPMPAEPIMPAPQPATPAPVEEPVGPTLEELEREAANHAAQAATGAPQTLSELEAAARQHADAALSQPAPAPQSELSAMPMPQPMETPAPAQPVIDQSGLPQLPPMPDFSTLPPVPTPGVPMPGQLPQLPGQPVMPAQPTLPEQPQAPQQPATPSSTPSAPADPSQFRIPGQ